MTSEAQAPQAPEPHALREAYERRAIQEYASPWRPDPHDRKFARVWALVEQRLPCDAFLDAGCGDGRYLGALARSPFRPRRTAAVDVSERILETAREAAAPLTPELVRAQLEEIPFEDEAFDLVLCSQVIEHLVEPDAGIAELARVLRADGTLILTTDNARNLVTRALYLGRLRRQAGFAFPHRDFDVGDLERRVRAAGLEIQATETFRFTAPRGFARATLGRIDAWLPQHRFGDIVAVVARRPA